MDEVQARNLLASYGVPFAPWRCVTRDTDTLDAAVELGFPVALKAIEPGILHKTEAGLVHVNLRSEEEVAEAVLAMRAVRPHPGGPLLVEKMIAGRRELLAGVSRDPQFGPVVMLGVGGMFAEITKDTAVAAAPVSESEARRLAGLLHGRALLGPFRGLPAVDLEALAGIVLALSRLALEHPEIAEVDLNPLILPDTGDGATVVPVAVDAVVVPAEPYAPSSAPKDSAAGQAGRPQRVQDCPPSPAHLAEENWRALFAPRSVVVAGASSNPSKWGGSLLVNLLRDGFPGTIYPVNARGGAIFGLQAYPRISDIPGTADLALAAVPAADLPAVIERCAAQGVKALVAVTAGFAEHSLQGAALERRVAEVASSLGVLLLGPNTVGVLSTHAMLTGLGAVALDIRPGTASLFSQSGNVAIALLLLAHEAGLGIGKFVGLGNEALVTSAEVITYYAGDPQTRLILGYIEGVKRGRAFIAAARAATTAKPVVLLRGGTSEAGGRAAASHTGALAGSDTVFSAVARQNGLIVTTDQNDFIDTAVALSNTPLPTGRRVAVVCSGGGWGVICADELVRQGLELAELPEDLIAELDQVFPELWSRRNPLDLVATISHRAVAFAVERLLANDAVDAVVMLGVLSMPFMLARVCDKAGAAEGEAHARFKTEEQSLADMPGPLMERYGKPVLAVEFAGTARPQEPAPSGESPVPGHRFHRLAVFPSPLRACRTLAHMADYAEYLRNLH